ncbi:uncharacterized protein SPSC_05657 [Sporisorium scitamineum]|uniref:BTB domain-containing protein n=1 Tax=Sporisorium scitamineum TaxID=49012 RepID=A0A0F7S9C3_9BASI|nr:uncharacterized protein SPSC_05657 [Sporisorium scitamineum]CDW97435.1 hypothetical protein [Sporisorium scitamineum]
MSFTTASPPCSPAFASPILVEAITAGTTNGSWGDVCFVMRSSHDDRSYATLFANLSILRARGAHHLVDQIVKCPIRTLEDATHVLHTPSPSASQQGALTLRRPASDAHTSNTNMSFYPVANISYTTMRPILVYLQTGHIEFAPLTSAIVNVDDEEDEEDNDDPDTSSLDTFVNVDTAVIGPQSTADTTSKLAASPKSVYRAARKFRLVELRRLAVAAIDQQITPANCLVELFDRFGLKYPEVYEQRLSYVLTHWTGIENRSDLIQLVSSSPLRAKAMEAFAKIMASTSIEQRT